MGPKMRAAIELMSDGVVRSIAELNELGFDRKVVKRLKSNGFIYNEQRGYYRISSEFEKTPEEKVEDNIKTFFNENAHLLEQAGPKSIFCLYTAAGLHGLSNDIPHTVWIAYPPEKGVVRFPEHLPVTGVRWRKPGSFDDGIMIADYEGKEVRLTSPERTLVDLLRFSNFIGEKTSKSRLMIDSDTVRVAFREYASKPFFNPTELSRLADRFGVSEMIKFYINISSSQKVHDKEDDLIDFEQKDFDPEMVF